MYHKLTTEPSADRLSAGQQAYIFSMLPGNLLFRVKRQSPQRDLIVALMDRNILVGQYHK